MVMASSQLHRNEPQALRLLANGQLALDIADGPVWLSSRRGLFATAAIAAFATNPGRAILDRVVWAPLNRPLHAWPSSRWFSDAQVVGEILTPFSRPDGRTMGCRRPAPSSTLTRASIAKG